MNGMREVWYLNEVKEKVKSLSRVWLFATPWAVAYQAPPSMGFPRQECWSELPFPPPGDLPNPGIEPWSPILQADALLSEPPGKSLKWKSDNNLEERMKIENNHSVDKSWWYFHIYFRTKVLSHFYNFFYLKVVWFCFWKVVDFPSLFESLSLLHTYQRVLACKQEGRWGRSSVGPLPANFHLWSQWGGSGASQGVVEKKKRWRCRRSGMLRPWTELFLDFHLVVSSMRKFKDE